MPAASCPVCDAEVDLGKDPIAGELLTCPDCGAELELTSLDPIAVQIAPEVDEDWGE